MHPGRPGTRNERGSSKAQDIGEEFTAQNVANTAWAFAKMERSPEALMAALGRRVLGIVGEFKAQGVANAAWTMASEAPREALGRGVLEMKMASEAPRKALGRRTSEAPREALGRRVLETKMEFMEQNVASTARAFGKMKQNRTWPAWFGRSTR